MLKPLRKGIIKEEKSCSTFFNSWILFLATDCNDKAVMGTDPYVD